MSNHPAEKIFRGGTIVTMDDVQSRVAAVAIAKGVSSQPETRPK